MFPKVYLITFGTIDEGWSGSIWSENGLIENVQVILLFVTIIFLINLYLKLKYTKINLNFRYFIIIEILGLSYFLLEEISWGQQIFNFQTTDLFLDTNSFLYNKQGETNLHNISNLFNELPRALVLIWCIIPILLRKKIIYSNNYFLSIMCPSKKLFIVSIIILIFFFPDFLISKLNLIDYTNLHVIENGVFIKFNLNMLFLITISTNFLRLSELQEFFYCYYFLWHTIFLKNLLIEKYVENN
tara:strand:+ start:122 stop:850 length:729 start_codon:yes stop_codon:yes gene_type:complete